MGYTTFWHRAQVLFILLPSVLVFFMGENSPGIYVCDDGVCYWSGGVVDVEGHTSILEFCNTFKIV